MAKKNLFKKDEDYSSKSFLKSPDNSSIKSNSKSSGKAKPKVEPVDILSFNGMPLPDWRRIKTLNLSGTLPYSDMQILQRRQILAGQMKAVFNEIENLGIPPEELFQSNQGESVKKADYGSLGRDEGCNEIRRPNKPCCTPAQIAAQLVIIKAAYVAAVAAIPGWKGCQDLSNIVMAAVAPFLSPCWTGKFIWRISVYPFGKFFPGEPDTFIHHAFAICPCDCENFGECDDCLVLDPYTITGFGLFQTAEIYKIKDWVAGGNVWHASSIPEHDNGVIYRYTMRYYCQRASMSKYHRAVCRIIRDLLKKELARFTGATGPVLDQLYILCGLMPDCC